MRTFIKKNFIICILIITTVFFVPVPAYASCGGGFWQQAGSFFIGTIPGIGLIMSGDPVAGTVGLACAIGITCSSGEINGTPVVIPQVGGTCNYQLPVKFYIPQMGQNLACTIPNPTLYASQITLSWLTGSFDEGLSSDSVVHNFAIDHIYRDASCSIKDTKGSYGKMDGVPQEAGGSYIYAYDPTGSVVGVSPGACLKLPILKCTPTNFSEANSEIAIYRSVLPVSSAPDPSDPSNNQAQMVTYGSWLFNQFAGHVGSGFGDVKNDTYIGGWTNPYSADDGCDGNGFNANSGGNVEGVPYFVGSASSIVNGKKLCEGNVCTFNDPDVPNNSYVAYVAKVIGVEYTGVTETVDVDYGYITTTTRTLPNKFLNNNNADFTTFPGPTNAPAFGNIIIGPYKTPSETAVCPVSCGSADGTTVSSAPTAGTLCSGTDTASAVSLSNVTSSWTGSVHTMYTWTCTGPSKAPTYQCPSNNNTAGSKNVCKAPYTCNGQTGTESTCVGSDHGDPCQFYHTYNCTEIAGSGGGLQKNCSATSTTPPPIPACGTANGKVYAYDATGYGSDTQCVSGTSSNTTFPAVGSRSAWLCTDADTGATSGQCLATRDAASAATGSLTLTPTSCVIASGASTCTVTASWNTRNTTFLALMDGNVGRSLSNMKNSPSEGLTVWVAYPQTVFNLIDALLDTKTATASCAAGSTWDETSGVCAPSVCTAPLTQTVTVACDANSDGVAATSGSVTRSQTKSAYPACAFGTPVTVDNSTYVSDNCVYPLYPPSCPDGVCNGSETNASCPADCPVPVCVGCNPDGTCTPPRVRDGSSCVIGCSNGAINYPACNTCSSWQTMISGSCINNCANDANNPPACTTCTAPKVWNGSGCAIVQSNVSISADPMRVQVTTTSTSDISWSATNVASGSCSVTGPNLAHTGFSSTGTTTESVRITAQSTYTITCKLTDNTPISDSVTVNVTPAFKEY